jgi:hypothetical protein
MRYIYGENISSLTEDLERSLKFMKNEPCLKILGQFHDIFYEFSKFVFCEVTGVFENFNFGIFGCHDHEYESFKFLPLKLRIIAMLTDSFSHLNGHDVTSRF